MGTRVESNKEVNTSTPKLARTIKGLHYQKGSFSESKIVRLP